MVVWYVVLGPTTVGSNAPLLEKTLSAGYPVGDLVLIFGIATVILRRLEETSRGPLVIFAVALTLFLIADLSYGYLEPLDRYARGDWPDPIWILAQFGFVVSAQYQYWRAEHEAAAPPALGIDPHHVSSMPYAAIALGHFLLIFSARNAGSYPLGGLVFGAVAITAVVLTRQLLLLRELRSLAVTDGLTGLPTRQHFTAQAVREFARTIRYSRSLAALLIDVDGFKSINDRHGHAVATRSSASLRDGCARRSGRSTFSGGTAEMSSWSRCLRALKTARSRRPNVSSPEYPLRRLLLEDSTYR